MSRHGINVGEVLLAIDKIYQMGFQFGQDYLYLEGRDLSSDEVNSNQVKTDNNDNRYHGVKEKVDLIVAQKYEHLSHSLVNGLNIIEASHHTLVAFIITGKYYDGFIESYDGTGFSQAAQRGRIRILGNQGEVVALA